VVFGYRRRVPDKPLSDIASDEALIRRLLRAQLPPDADSAEAGLVHAGDGWDCRMWRLGDGLAVRLPRRAAAAELIRHEQRFLPGIASRLVPTGVGVPVPVFAGAPAAEFPWPWSIVPWFDGEPGLLTARSERSGWAIPLADALIALHSPAAPGYPENPYRGVPLAERDDAVRERLAQQREAGREPALLDRLEERWRAGLAARPWTGAPVWIHGDLHPGNLISRDGALAAIIDFGDVTAGDPAYDLAVGWLALDASARAAFRSRTAGRYDAATWTRAEAWAVSMTLMLLAHSDDDPAYATLGRDCLRELSA
jgi:aminoglycoside phosphotransferase (APT) family kinase protein